MDNLLLVLIAALAVVQVFTILNPGLAALLKVHVAERVQRRVQNAPAARRELLEYAVSTAYYAVEQFRQTTLFERALAASEDLTRQDLLKQETLRRAKQLLLVMGVDVPDDGLLMAVLDTLVERLIQQENAGQAVNMAAPPSVKVNIPEQAMTPEQRAALVEALQQRAVVANA
jgi:hypothetical protein